MSAAGLYPGDSGSSPDLPTDDDCTCPDYPDGGYEACFDGRLYGQCEYYDEETGNGCGGACQYYGDCPCKKCHNRL